MWEGCKGPDNAIPTQPHTLSNPTSRPPNKPPTYKQGGCRRVAERSQQKQLPKLGIGGAMAAANEPHHKQGVGHIGHLKQNGNSCRCEGTANDMNSCEKEAEKLPQHRWPYCACIASVTRPTWQAPLPL